MVTHFCLCSTRAFSVGDVSLAPLGRCVVETQHCRGCTRDNDGKEEQRSGKLVPAYWNSEEQTTSTMASPITAGPAPREPFQRPRLPHYHLPKTPPCQALRRVWFCNSASLFPPYSSCSHCVFHCMNRHRVPLRQPSSIERSTSAAAASSTFAAFCIGSRAAVVDAWAGVGFPLVPNHHAVIGAQPIIPAYFFVGHRSRCTIHQG